MKVLLATDGSKDALDAQAILSAMKLPAGSEIFVLSVVPLPHLVTPGLGREGELRPAPPGAEAVMAAEEAAKKASAAVTPSTSRRMELSSRRAVTSE